MRFDEAVAHTLPHLRQEALKHPDMLIALVAIPNNPIDPDGSGRTYIVGAPDLSDLKEMMKLTRVQFFIWRGDLYQVTKDKTLVFVDWMKHGFRLA